MLTFELLKLLEDSNRLILTRQRFKCPFPKITECIALTVASCKSFHSNTIYDFRGPFEQIRAKGFFSDFYDVSRLTFDIRKIKMRAK